jgi:hypothetical protein
MRTPHVSVLLAEEKVLSAISFGNFQLFSYCEMRTPHVPVLSAKEKVLVGISCCCQLPAFPLWRMRAPHVLVLLAEEKVLSAIFLATSSFSPTGR